MSKRAGIYTRMSMDRTGAGLGVERQEAECRALCDRMGWDVSIVWADNDVSASTRKPRPGWQQALAAGEAQEIDVLVGWHVDRMTRQPRELEDLIDLADRSGLALATATGEIDLGTPTGRMVARMLGAAARHEIEHKVERQRAERAQYAAAGKPNLGGRRPFGYCADRVTINEPEAAIVREAAARLLAGESMRGLTRDLADRGVVGTSGKPMLSGTLRQILGGPRISGRRSHDDTHDGTRRMGANAPIVADAVWPAIISPQMSDRLRALLTDPSRRRKTSMSSGTLLTGLLVCTDCQHRMTSGSATARKGARVMLYQCVSTRPLDMCRRSVTRHNADREVVARFLTFVASTEAISRALSDRPSDGQALLDQLSADSQMLDQISIERSLRQITDDEWRPMRDALVDRMTQTRETLAREMYDDALLPLLSNPTEAEQIWAAATLSQQRTMLAAAIERVEIEPVGRIGNRWNPERVHVIWR